MDTRILKVTETEYILLSDAKVKYTSSIEQLVVNCAYVGIKFSELEAALTEMIKHDHNFANFGFFNKDFVFSGKI